MLDQLYALLDLVNQALEMYLDELQDWLALKHDVLVSITTLDRDIWEAGLSYKLLCHAAAERDEVTRAE